MSLAKVYCTREELCVIRYCHGSMITVFEWFLGWFSISRRLSLNHMIFHLLKLNLFRRHQLFHLLQLLVSWLKSMDDVRDIKKNEQMNETNIEKISRTRKIAHSWRNTLVTFLISTLSLYERFLISLSLYDVFH